jgi:hypothetical protein
MAVGYQYVIQGEGGVEPLGMMPLSNDAEALSFAEDIIRDLTLDGTKYYAACTMTITSGNRVVAKMPIGS